VNNAAVFAEYIVTGSVVDGTGYRKVPISYLAGSGTFSGQVAWTFSPAGNKGVDGVGGDTYGSAAAGLDGHVPVFDGDGYHFRDGGTLGTLAFLSSVNGGNWSGTDLAVVDGGTGASTAAGARTNLGLVIGTDVQAYDATLTSIAALGTAADKLAYTTGVDTWAEAAFTSFGRTVVATANAAALRTAAGLVIGTDVQAYDGELAAIAGLTSAANKFPYFTGSGPRPSPTFRLVRAHASRRCGRATAAARRSASALRSRAAPMASSPARIRRSSTASPPARPRTRPTRRCSTG
jgi:hypothetical protein